MFQTLSIRARVCLFVFFLMHFFSRFVVSSCCVVFVFVPWDKNIYVCIYGGHRRQIVKLRRLKKLQLSFNNLRSLPPGMEGLRGLELCRCVCSCAFLRCWELRRRFFGGAAFVVIVFPSRSFVEGRYVHAIPPQLGRELRVFGTHHLHLPASACARLQRLHVEHLCTSAQPWFYPSRSADRVTPWHALLGFTVVLVAAVVLLVRALVLVLVRARVDPPLRCDDTMPTSTDVFSQKNGLTSDRAE